MTLTELEPFVGRQVVDYVGEPIGELVDVFADIETGQPVWLSVRAGADPRPSLVPLEGARPQGSSLAVVYAKDQVESAPRFPGDQDLSPQQEQVLARHYRGLNAGEELATPASGQQTARTRLRSSQPSRAPAAPRPSGPSPSIASPSLASPPSPSARGGMPVDPSMYDPQGQTTADAGRQVAGAAAEQAGQLTQTVTNQTKQVAASASDQAHQVAQGAAAQARNVLEDAKAQVHDQAQVQTDRLAEALGRLRDQSRALLDGRAQDAGPLADYAEDGVAKLDRLTRRLQSGGFDGAVDELQRFARRRPGAFLLGAGAIGFGVGRLLRAGAANPGTAQVR